MVLDSMAAMEVDGIDYQIIVVDNNGTDHTKDVVMSFENRLPMVYHYETKPGKNCALNRVLDEFELGELVVFTDDDACPRPVWLRAIVACSKRHPEYAVFGGKIEPRWPFPQVPQWATDPEIKKLGYAWQDLGAEEKPYPHDVNPYGPNFWMRREVFEQGRRFDENIGPRPGDRSMGDETSFMRQMRTEGQVPFYCPDAVIEHCIQPQGATISTIRSRAFHYGKGVARMQPLCQEELFQSSAMKWYLRRYGALMRMVFKLLFAMMSFSLTKRVIRSVDAIKWIAYNNEMIYRAKSGSGKNPV